MPACDAILMLKQRLRMPMPPLLRGITDLEVEAPEEFEAIIQRHLPPTTRITRAYPLEGHLHSLYLMQLSNGSHLLLKCSPKPTTPLLRREQIILETEAMAIALLNQSATPLIPSLLHYDSRREFRGPAYLIRHYLPGPTLEEIASQLTIQDRETIDRSLGALANRIGQHSSQSFGPLEQVAYGAGKPSWKDAFAGLLEGILRDSEDVFVNLPYAQIRQQVNRLSSALEDVTSPQLVIIDFGQPSQVVVDPESKEVCGITGFGNAVWGDLFMAEIFEDPSPAVVDGFGSIYKKSKAEKVRQLLYSCYRSVHRIVVQYYRNDRSMAAEIEARRRLMTTLGEMATIENQSSLVGEGANKVEKINLEI